MSFDEKKNLTGEFLFSALSVALNNRLSNFERLSVNYLPIEERKEFENSTRVTNEILQVSKMLQIKGMPSHASLISHILRKNLHIDPGNPYISQLFNLIESENSPFTISKQGSAALDKAIEVMPNLAKYAPFIRKTLAIRIL